ncbi:MAG: transposase, partial [Candidatus Thermoplasmatota archaeon]|nr:transposase [Candidatus Thermoplasmatota archaeon]
MPGYECRIARIDTDITTYWILARMGSIATKLYNTALWHSRKQWEETGKIPSGYDLQKVVLTSNYHSYLPAHTYQHVAHQVGNAYKSWFTLRKKDKTTRPPFFRPKGQLSTTMFDAFKVKDNNNTIFLTLSKSLKEEMRYPYKWLCLRLKWNTPLPKDGKITQIEIVPREGYFELHAKILLPEPTWRTEGQIMAIDLGMRNPIVSRDEQDNINIFRGGEILSNLHYWNKEKSRVQAEVMGRTRGKKKNSKSLSKMSKHGSAQVKHAVHSLTSTFADLCNQKNVKEVVIGDLKGIKKEEKGKGKNWRDKSSQNWQQFPIRTVVTQLGYKLARYGIRLIEIDERGTSRGRCSICGCEDKKKLHRVHRGLFLCGSCSTQQNADVNGASNILVRYLHQIGNTNASGDAFYL